jgi:hypothetical protein
MNHGAGPGLVRLGIVAALVVVLSGCAAAAGGSGSEGGSGGTSSDAGGDQSGGGASIDPCTVPPDDALEAAMGQSPGDREEYLDSGSEYCRITGTGDPAVYLTLQYAPGGRDYFEQMRDWKDDLPDLYSVVEGVGEDAFAFGTEVTTLVGDRSVVVFLEGLPFDDVPEADRRARAAALAQAIADELQG